MMPALGRRRALLGLLLLAGALLGTPPAVAATAPATSAPKAKAATPPASGTRPRAPTRPATPPVVKRPTRPTVSPLERAMEARSLEDVGAYTRAAETLRELRSRVAPDPDLELALALNEARAGQIDSADVRLHGALLSAAAADTLAPNRWVEYPVDRERMWFNGRFDGWHWYVWRARLEVAARFGRWDEALAAARQCARWRANSGKEWALLAVCAGRAHEDAESRQAAAWALRLDPSLPEGSYLAGLWSARSGRRAEAQTLFRQATTLDSSYRDAALALVRSRLPMAMNDTMPSELLHGARRAALLTSPVGPKLEDEIHVDTGATADQILNPLKGDSLRVGTKPVQISVSLLVGQQGRVVLNDLPWYAAGQVPMDKVARWLAGLPDWTFLPAHRNGAPVAIWISVDLKVNP